MNEQLDAMTEILRKINEIEKARGESSKTKNIDSLVKMLEKITDTQSNQSEDIHKSNIDDNNAHDYGNEYIDKLKLTCQNFLRKESFEVGQIVKWKEGLRNRKFPFNNQPAIVVSVLEKPVISTDYNKSGSPFYLEPLDIILGIIVDDGVFLTFYHDSRRFEAY